MVIKISFDLVWEIKLPSSDQLIASSLGLMPGDIFITEIPYEDSSLEDFSPIKSLKCFDASHLAIWTGSHFTKPLAHAVAEGYKLPGIRLTHIGDGRHIIFRLANRPLAEGIAIIARRWAMSSSIFDLTRFEKVYPKRFWADSNGYDQHKHDFFSIPNVTTSGPATPYDFERASAQRYDRGRNPLVIKFTENSLRRAIKFASRSELMGPISKGMRCTSFVVSTVQAAVLSAITKQTVTKTSFKHFKEFPFSQYSKATLSTAWNLSEKGKQLQHAVETQDFRAVFPEGMAIDSKYAFPGDILTALSQSEKEWVLIGSFCLYQGTFLHLNTNKKKPTEEISDPLSIDIEAFSMETHTLDEKSPVCASEEHCDNIAPFTMK